MIPAHAVEVGLGAGKDLTPSAIVDVLAAFPDLAPGDTKTHDAVVEVVAAEVRNVVAKCRVASAKVRIGENSDADAPDLSGLCQGLRGGARNDRESKKAPERDSDSQHESYAVRSIAQVPSGDRDQGLGRRSTTRMGRSSNWLGRVSWRAGMVR